jgi:hypothetical protein
MVEQIAVNLGKHSVRAEIKGVKIGGVPPFFPGFQNGGAAQYSCSQEQLLIRRGPATGFVRYSQEGLLFLCDLHG